jgi:hypothetical protein
LLALGLMTAGASAEQEPKSSTLVVDEKNAAGLRGVKPGDKIAITVKEASGGEKTLTAIVNGSISSTREHAVPGQVVLPRAESGVVELTDLDPTAKKVTILGDRGLKRVFVVDGKARLSLVDVSPGQTVSLSYRFDAQGKPEAVVHVTPAPVVPPVRIEGGIAVELGSR